MHNKVTIGIPVFKVEGYIKRTMESVLSQTYDNIEIFEPDDLDEDIKLATIKAYEAIKYLQSNYTYNGEQRYILRIAIMSILSKCTLNKDIHSFNDLVQIIVDDPDFIIDDIELNYLDIYEDEYLIVERILRIIETKYNKNIK